MNKRNNEYDWTSPEVLFIGVIIGVSLIIGFLFLFEHHLVFNPEYEVCTKQRGGSTANIHYPVGRHKYCWLENTAVKHCFDCVEWRLSNGRSDEKRDYRFVGSEWWK